MQTMWYSNSKTIKKELRRCILVCKNCYYELHNKKHENGSVSGLDRG